MKFTFSLLITLFITISGYSQQLSDYKYILVPEQFQFFDAPNKYSLNVATLHQLNKYGFKAFMGLDQLPIDARENICDVLKLKAEDDSSFFRTKLKLILEDCDGEIVFVSNEGSSKEKDYQRAYSEAFREALLSFKGLKIKKKEQEGSSKNVQVVSIEESKPTQSVVKKNTQKNDKVGKIKKDKPSDRSSKPSSSHKGKLSYKSKDGFYRMIQEGNTLIFFENQKKIGTANAIANTHFPIDTSEFSGTGYFDNGNLIVKRIVKGIGEIEMKFFKE